MVWLADCLPVVVQTALFKAATFDIDLGNRPDTCMFHASTLQPHPETEGSGGIHLNQGKTVNLN